MCEIKYWRREVQDKEKWRKTINKEVKPTTVRSDAVHVIHEHEERAKKRRTDDSLLDCNKKMNSPPSPSTTTVINVDATCSLCGRTFKSKRAMNIHKRVCIQKRSTEASTDTKEMHQLTATSSTNKNTATKNMKIINLLIKKDENKYICPNNMCRKILKPQGATMHVKACAKAWRVEKEVQT
ncbi:unnamed protein product [Rotaria sp. Silwood2]|nr:unnamed protein product [Rotaria sp. Silwood2]